MKVLNLQDKFAKFSDLWSPKVIAEMNNYQFKLVKINNEFTFHKHLETDEVFIVIEGEMFIEFTDSTVKLQAGEMIVVPKGTEHKPYATNECKIMLVEPKGTVNTGDSVEIDRTAPNDDWI